eukprot:1159702-Pelagomonas_calceolata.AAC.2
MRACSAVLWSSVQCKSWNGTGLRQKYWSWLQRQVCGRYSAVRGIQCREGQCHAVQCKVKCECEQYSAARGSDMLCSARWSASCKMEYECEQYSVARGSDMLCSARWSTWMSFCMASATPLFCIYAIAWQSCIWINGFLSLQAYMYCLVGLVAL